MVLATAQSSLWGTSSLGVAQWGQLDLAGNVWQWTMDWYSIPYVNPCTDCGYLSVNLVVERGMRGGNAFSPASQLIPAYRSANAPSPRNYFSLSDARELLDDGQCLPSVHARLRTTRLLREDPPTSDPPGGLRRRALPGGGGAPGSVRYLLYIGANGRRRPGRDDRAVHAGAADHLRLRRRGSRGRPGVQRQRDGLRGVLVLGRGRQF